MRATLVALIAAALFAAPAFAKSGHRAAASGHSRGATHRSAHTAAQKTSSGTRRKGAKATAAPHKLHGQQGIDSQRAAQIQEALIREHYLTGEPTGQWDAETQAAMQKYQADQGWQTKLMPDSRALKKLGLGPDYSGAINAGGAGFAAPPPVSSLPGEQAAGFAAASGVN